MRSKYKFKMKPYNDAIKIGVSSFEARSIRKYIDVLSAKGYRIAMDIYSEMDLPPYNMSFYDGYAVHHEDTFGAKSSQPKILKLVGSIFKPTDVEDIKLSEGECVYVSANSPLPEGADAVVREEYTEKKGDTIIIKKEVRMWEDVVLKGEDVKKGEILIKKGSIIRGQDVGLMLEMGLKRVCVYRKPVIGLVSTGDELLEELEGGNPYPDNYSIIIKDLLDSLGIKTEILGIVHDDIEEIQEVIINNIESFDAIAIIGGASRGENDRTGSAIEKIGEIIFHATNLSPGKVSGLAKVRGKPVFIVPAHIGSAVSCIYNIMIPILSKIYLDGIQLIPKVNARLTADVDAKAYSYTFRTVKLRYTGEQLLATPHIKRLGGSTLLTILSQAQGYILLPPGSRASKGDLVEVNLFSPIEVLSWEMD